GVLLPGGRFQHEVGQPPLLDVLAERLAPTGRVADPSLSQLYLGLLPRPVGSPLAGKGTGRAFRAAQVDVDSGVSRFAVLADTLLCVPHQPPGLLDHLSVICPWTLRHSRSLIDIS